MATAAAAMPALGEPCRPMPRLACMLIVWLTWNAEAFRPEGVDPYEVLGLQRGGDLSKEALKKAYRQAALRWHPDKVAEADKKEAERMFIAVAWAYEVLSDPGQRGAYDAPPGPGGPGGAAGGRAGAGPSGPFAHPGADGFSMKKAAKLFEDVFGEQSAEFRDLIQHLSLHATSSMGDTGILQEHAESIKKATGGRVDGDFSVETQGADGRGRIKTTQTSVSDGRGSTTKITITENSHSSAGGAGTPALNVVHGNPALDAHMAAHMAAHEAAVRAHQQAVAGMASAHTRLSHAEL